MQYRAEAVGRPNSPVAQGDVRQDKKEKGYRVRVRVRVRLRLCLCVCLCVRLRLGLTLEAGKSPTEVPRVLIKINDKSEAKSEGKERYP